MRIFVTNKFFAPASGRRSWADSGIESITETATIVPFALCLVVVASAKYVGVPGDAFKLECQGPRANALCAI